MAAHRTGPRSTTEGPLHAPQSLTLESDAATIATLSASEARAALYLLASRLEGREPSARQVALAAGLKGGKRSGQRIRDRLTETTPRYVTPSGATNPACDAGFDDRGSYWTTPLGDTPRRHPVTASSSRTSGLARGTALLHREEEPPAKPVDSAVREALAGWGVEGSVLDELAAKWAGHADEIDELCRDCVPGARNPVAVIVSRFRQLEPGSLPASTTDRAPASLVAEMNRLRGLDSVPAERPRRLLSDVIAAHDEEWRLHAMRKDMAEKRHLLDDATTSRDA